LPATVFGYLLSRTQVGNRAEMFTLGRTTDYFYSIITDCRSGPWTCF